MNNWNTEEPIDRRTFDYYNSSVSGYSSEYRPRRVGTIIHLILGITFDEHI